MLFRSLEGQAKLVGIYAALYTKFRRGDKISDEASKEVEKDELGFTSNSPDDKTLDAGPWYACKKVPTVHHTMGGIQINTDAEVLGADGKPVPGLYACGEVIGGIHGSNRLGGNAIADCMVFGKNRR